MLDKVARCATRDEAQREERDQRRLARSISEAFGIGGGLGLAWSRSLYSCLYAMRVGLLSRFWGSLGIALGAASLVFFQFALLWFVYFGFLLPAAGSPAVARPPGPPAKRFPGRPRARKPPTTLATRRRSGVAEAARAARGPGRRSQARSGKRPRSASSAT